MIIDWYSLLMAQAWHLSERASTPAVFDLAFRGGGWTFARPWLMAGGINEAVAWVTGLGFDAEFLDFLEAQPDMRPDFLDRLAAWEFGGTLTAVAEGSVVFADEPVLTVRASLFDAILLEAGLLALVGSRTAWATTAARMVLVARGTSVVDFSPRRTTGASEALAVSRMAYMAGFAATANVEAARRFGMPLVGTMAHAWVQSFPTEAAAFTEYARWYPKGRFLVDTYHAPAGIATATAVAQALELREWAGVRIDSGDLGALARAASRSMAAAGLGGNVVISGDLDEYAIERHVAAKAPIGGFGVGAKLAHPTGIPAPVYKLVQLDATPVMKTSPGKEGWPADKVVWRRRRQNGTFVADLVGLRGQEPEWPDAVPLHVTCLGEPTNFALARTGLTLTHARQTAAWNLETLPPELAVLENAQYTPVIFSTELQALRAELGGL